MKRNYIIIVAVVVILMLTVLLFDYNKPENKVIREAKKYLGQEELPGNTGFKDKEFETLMRSVGWLPGDQWCNYFVRLVFLIALENKKYFDRLQGNYRNYTKDYTGLISANVFLTWNNFKNAGLKQFEISDKPKRGGLVVWQSYTNPNAGHIGIVVKAKNKYFKTIEGNSNNIVVNLKDYKKNVKKDKDLAIQTNYSEGMVAEHIRSYDGDGMKLLGFINFK